MNEVYFFIQAIAVTGFMLIFLKLGKAALTSFVAASAILANLFVVKQISLFGFSVTCSDAFAVGGIFGLNLLQEYFGKEAARRAIYTSLGLLLFYLVFAQIHLMYTPAKSDFSQGAFEVLLSHSPRIIGASLVSFFIVQQVDLRLFSYLKGKLVKRISLSLLCSQLLDTVLFSLLGLYGLVPSIWEIILVSFLIKVILIFLSAPFAAFSKKLVPHAVSV